jgi:hypothetical protein
MGLKIFDYYLDYDFGHSLDFIVGQFKKFNLIEGTCFTTEWAEWEPNLSLSVSVFKSSVFAFDLSIWKFYLRMSFIHYRAAMDIKFIRDIIEL